MIILLSCLAVAMCFTTLGLGFVNLASGPRIPAPVAEAKLAPPQVRATPARLIEEPVLEPVQPESVRKKILEEKKKQIETGMADVGRQSRELDQAKRELALKQETLAKTRNSLAELQKQSQEMARQASERSKSLSQLKFNGRRRWPMWKAVPRRLNGRWPKPTAKPSSFAVRFKIKRLFSTRSGSSEGERPENVLNLWSVFAEASCYCLRASAFRPTAWAAPLHLFRL